MIQRKSLAAAVLAATSVLGLGTAAHAAPAVVAVQSAPPAPAYERAPAPREGYVWAPGHYDWRNGQYVWVSGRWLEARNGWEYRPAEWVQRSDGSWYLTAAEWVRRDNYASNDRYNDDDRAQRRWERRFGPNGDLDRDGILNQDDRDRDGDGVRNRYDRYPDDPDRE
jgi:hypothetical protein